MVNTKAKVFFVAILDFFVRHKTVDSLVKKILTNSSITLNVTTLYSKDLKLDNFREKIYSSSFDGKKILIIKEVTELKDEIKDFFVKNIREIILNNYFIFETENDINFFKDKKFANDEFFTFLFKNSTKIFLQDTAKNLDLFGNLKKYIRTKNLDGIIYTVEKLFKEYPNDEKLATQILGLLTWEFVASEDLNEKAIFLEELFKLDRTLKEKNINPKVAIGRTVFRLFGGSS